VALKVTRVDVWVAGMKDQPGSLAEKLDVLAAAGAQLEFVLARRAPEKRGAGVVFLAPIEGAAPLKAAKKLGFHKSKSVIAVRVEGPDKPGMGARITKALGDKRVNLRGLSAGVIGKRFVLHVALDTKAAAAKTVRILKQLR